MASMSPQWDELEAVDAMQASPSHARGALLPSGA